MPIRLEDVAIEASDEEAAMRLPISWIRRPRCAPRHPVQLVESRNPRRRGAWSAGIYWTPAPSAAPRLEALTGDASSLNSMDAMARRAS